MVINAGSWPVHGNQLRGPTSSLVPSLLPRDGETRVASQHGATASHRAAEHQVRTTVTVSSYWVVHVVACFCEIPGAAENAILEPACQSFLAELRQTLRAWDTEPACGPPLHAIRLRREMVCRHKRCIPIPAISTASSPRPVRVQW